jgi:ACT domain-containing protein
MKKYRIIQKDILCDGMKEKDALEAIQMLKSTNPDKIYEIEVYDFNPLANRMGRDPDLH